MTKVKYLKNPLEYVKSSDYDKCFDAIYEELEFQHNIKLNRIYPSEELYIDLEDINKITERLYISWDLHKLLNYISGEPLVELLTKERLENDKVYAIINYSNIRVYQGSDNNYYTAEKIQIKDIELKKMISLKDYIENSKIYEGLLSSWDSKTLKEKLMSFIGIKKDDIVLTHTNKNKSQIKIDISYIDFNDEIERCVKQIANMSGYTYIISQNDVILSPFHPESANKIVKENNNIVYHQTSKYFYDKIKERKYIPLRSNIEFPNESKKDEHQDNDKNRLYCFVGDIKDLKDEFETFRRQSLRLLNNNKLPKYYDKDVVLIIDLNKCDKETNWYYDPHYKTPGGWAVFTNNFIPVKCIIGEKYIKNGKFEI